MFFAASTLNYCLWWEINQKSLLYTAVTRVDRQSNRQWDPIGDPSLSEAVVIGAPVIDIYLSRAQT